MPDLAHICVTCGTQFSPTPQPPTDCPICQDARQYVGRDGQQWTSLEALRATHRARIEEVAPGLLGIGMEPQFAIGQRALLADGLLWDCVPLVDDAIGTAVEAHGGIDAIAISHPHYYSSMVEWADRFDARILLHEADRNWVMRPSERIELWSGERYRVSESLELHRLGGHFTGGTICLWQPAGGREIVFSGDIIQVVADRNWVSFMWSYPNLIPLPAAEVERIAARVAELDFDHLYGAWWPAVVGPDAKSKVARSAVRYLNALQRTAGE